MVNDLLNTLRQLEEELHRTATRRDRSRLNVLLHPEFEEIGRSGKRYNRTQILNEFSEEGALPDIRAENYTIAVISQGIALLTYKSAHVDGSGGLHRHTLRSSLWVQSQTGWQLRFHQGTPTDA